MGFRVLVLVGVLLASVADAQPLEIVLPGSSLFAPGSSAVSQHGRQVILSVAGRLDAQTNIRRIEVVGHTDSSPVKSQRVRRLYRDNVGLSRARAQAVAQLLTQAGVDPRKVVSRGEGSRRPLFAERLGDGSLDRESMARNRRVHIRIHRASRKNLAQRERIRR